MNGKPGDHPLTDIFIHKLEVYGKETDDIIKKIGNLSSKRELDEWWENNIGWNAKLEDVLQRAKAKLIELEDRAKDSGWEIR